MPVAILDAAPEAQLLAGHDVQPVGNGIQSGGSLKEQVVAIASGRLHLQEQQKTSQKPAGHGGQRVMQQSKSS